MRKLLFFVGVFMALPYFGFTQKLLISGPMLGYVEHREALVWLEVSPDVKKVEIRFQKQGRPETTKSVFYKDPLSMAYNPIKLRLENLDMNSTYEYSVWLNDRKMDFPFSTTLKTKKIWEWREPAPEMIHYMTAPASRMVKTLAFWKRWAICRLILCSGRATISTSVRPIIAHRRA
jgi:hypothetical protein